MDIETKTAEILNLKALNVQKEDVIILKINKEYTDKTTDFASIAQMMRNQFPDHKTIEIICCYTSKPQNPELIAIDQNEYDKLVRAIEILPHNNLEKNNA